MNFPLVDGFKEAAWRFALNGFAVLIIAIVGGLCVGSLFNLFAKLVFGKMLPASALRFVRVGGGLTTGFIAGMFVFSGGGGLGWGGTGANAPTDQPAASLNAKPVVAPIPAPLRITLLGGVRVKDEAFYLLDGSPDARKLAEVQTLLTDLKGKSAVLPKLDLRIYDDSVARSHAAVVELEQWAMAQGFSVTVETTTGTLPIATKADPS
jgi:hypothetical protein